MYNHKKIRIAFHKMLQKIKLPLCYTLRHAHVEKSATVFLTVRNEKSCTTRLSLHACVYLMQIDSFWLYLFDWKPWYTFLFTLDWTSHIGSLIESWESCIYLFFFCVLLLVFPCSCTGCGVCPILQLSAGQDTSLVQSVTQSGLLHSTRTRGYLVFTKGAWNE